MSPSSSKAGFYLTFARIEEGYPCFMYDMSAKQNNTLVFTR